MEKHEFKPKEWVLVRDDDGDEWSLNVYSHKHGDFFYGIGCGWCQCIPYEGNEHLLGTSNSPEKKPNEEFKFGDKVKCKRDDTWEDGLFVVNDDSFLPCLVFFPEENDIEWFCREDVRHA